MTPEDARALPGDAVPERLQGPAVIYRTAVFLQDGRLARPSLPTLPGTDGTIGRQGPGVRLGRLGTLGIFMRCISRCSVGLVSLRIAPGGPGGGIGPGWGGRM